MPGLGQYGCWSFTERDNLARSQPGFSFTLSRPVFTDKWFPEACPPGAHLLPPHPLSEPWSTGQAKHLSHLVKCGSKNNLRSIWQCFPAGTNGASVHDPDPGSCGVGGLSSRPGRWWKGVVFLLLLLLLEISLYPSLSGQMMPVQACWPPGPSQVLPCAGSPAHHPHGSRCIRLLV